MSTLAISLMGVMVACAVLCIGPLLLERIRSRNPFPTQDNGDFERKVNHDLIQRNSGSLLQVEITNYRDTLHGFGAEAARSWLKAVYALLLRDYPQWLWRYNENGRFMAWHSTAGQGQWVADNIIESLDKPLAAGEAQISPQLAIGIVDHSMTAAPLSVWIAQADCAAMHASSRKKTKMEYDVSMDIGVIDKLITATRFKAAVNDEHLLIHYQPIVNVVTGLPVAIEALLRWPQADGRLQAADHFIARAAETGKMTQLSSWVLDESLSLLKLIHQMGAKINLHLNLSQEDIADEHLVERLQKTLESHGVDPQYLRLEISAKAFESQPGLLQRHCDGLVVLGVQLIVHDFGYSRDNLGQLVTLPLSNLKLDRSFVEGMDDNDSDMAVVRAAIYLATSINIPLIAEGVERAEQAAYLFKYGCNCMQGYWFARPMDSDSILRWLRQTWSPNHSDNDAVWNRFNG